MSQMLEERTHGRECHSPKIAFQRGGSSQRMKWISTQFAKSHELKEEQFAHQIGCTATPPYQVQLTVNNKRVIMGVDTGLAVSLISYKTYLKMFASVLFGEVYRY